jgi:hypothetical protein
MKRKCECCGGDFETNTTDEEAVAEYKERFPGHQVEEAKVICSPCYERFWRWYDEHSDKTKRAQLPE